MKFQRDSDNTLKNIAHDIIRRNKEFKDLLDAKIRILFVWREKPRTDDDGRTVAARVSRLSPRWRDITGKDVEIEVCSDVWARIDMRWKRRLMEHELRHIRLYRDEDHPEQFELDNDDRLYVEIQPHNIVIRSFEEEIAAWGFDVGDLPAAKFIYEAYRSYKQGKLKTYRLPEVLQSEDAIEEAS